MLWKTLCSHVLVGYAGVVLTHLQQPRLQEADGTSLMPSYLSGNFAWSGITDAELHERGELRKRWLRGVRFRQGRAQLLGVQGLWPHQGEVPIRPQGQEAVSRVHQWSASSQSVGRQSRPQPPISSDCAQARSLAHEEQGDDE